MNLLKRLLRKPATVNTFVIAGQRVGPALVAVNRIPKERPAHEMAWLKEHRN